MQIIISPAKQMKADRDSIEPGENPLFLDETRKLLEKLQTYNREELKRLFRANDKITEENYQRYACMELKKGYTPAVLSYVGLQYQYMAPQIFTIEQWDYVRKHLWILSGFYGMLRPDHGVLPYRLEMQAKLSMGEAKDLYAFWGDKLYRELVKKDKVVLNLASREYAKAVEPYLEKDVRYITCVFGSIPCGMKSAGQGIQDGKVKVKGTEAKMARGEMVRWISLNQIEEPEKVRQFEGLGFSYCPDYSTEREYVFLKKTTVLR